MPGKAGTLETLAQQVGLAFKPLPSLLAAGRIIPFFAELGLKFPPQLLQPNFVAALNATSAAASSLTTLLDQFDVHLSTDDQVGIGVTGGKLLTAITQVTSGLPQIGTQLITISGTLPGMNAPDVVAFAKNLPSSIVAYLLISRLENQQPAIVGIANVLGVLSYDIKPPVTGIVTDPPTVERKLQLSNLARALSAPLKNLAALYKWGEPGLDGTLLIPKLSALLSLFGLYAHPLDPALPNALTSGFLDIEINSAINPPGLTATLNQDLPAGFKLTLPLSERWSVQMEVQGVFTAGVRATVAPPSRVALKPPAGQLNGLVQMGLFAQAADDSHPLILLSLLGGSRVQAQSLKLSAGLDARWDAGSQTAIAEPVMRFEVSGGKAIIDASGADSFITKILAGLRIESNFDLSAEYSLNNGIRFRGSSTLELLLASHVSAGPFSVEALTFGIGIKDQAFPISIAADVQTTLGPLTAVVQGIGFKFDLTLDSENKGNLGPINLKPGFQLPKGVGLSLDAGGFKGGGFLMLDAEKGEYAGALELDFQGLCSVKAIAIINTKMPNGDQGFSLLIVISAEFIPIQLGFGFTLNGVGGIFGLNRKIQVSALADGIRTNAIKSILFPDNIVANIIRIISDIKQFFPPQPDHFVVGPMAKLGWGTPSIVTVELGLLLDLPEPMFAIVGVLKCMLPAEEFALLRFQVNFIGVVDFGHGYIFFRADLYDSRLLFFALTGSLAFLVSWGEAQTFAISVGGFHPDFHDIPSIPALPNGFRGMARVGISLLSDDNPRLKIESYFAVTSNSVQFGSKVELYAGAGGFNVYGYLGFDVLFQFSPFRFDARLYGGIALRIDEAVIAGITIEARLAGPTPWDVRGEACLTILFIEICVGFHVTWGDDPPAIPAATEDLLKLLLNEYADSRNWRAELPPNNHLHVTLKKIEEVPNTDTLVIHPAGVLTFSQRSLPLEDYLIEKLGAKKPLAENKFKLSNANSDGMSITANFSDVRELFAPGNFSALSDSDKLSRHSFEKLPSGFRLSRTSDLVTAVAVQRPVDYELSYLRQKTLHFKGLVKMALTAYNRLVKGSAVRQSSLSKQQTRVSMNAPPPAELPKEAFTIASTSDLTPHLKDSNAVVFFGTQAEAYQRQKELLASDPNLLGTIQVVSHFELNLN